MTGLTDDVEFSYGYDVLGRKTSVSAAVGSTDDYVNGYSYDNLGRITQITQDGVTGGNAVAEKRVDFGCSDDGTRATISRFADLAGTKAVAETEKVFDELGRVTDIVHERAATDFAEYDLTWDAAGRISDFDFDSLVGDDGDAAYSYDDTNQLTASDYASDWQTDESYTYDDNGNRTNTGYTTGDHNRLTSDGTYNFTYDNEGNVLTKTNISTSESVEYTWDHRNRLTKVTFKNSGGTATKIVEYSYDFAGQMVERTVDTDADSTADQRRIFSHTAGQVALHFESQSASDLSGSDLERRYLWTAQAVDSLLADETIDGTQTADDILWPLADNLNTTRDVVRYSTSTDTVSVTNHLTYDAFGNVTSETSTASADDTLFHHTGKILDEHTGLQWHNYRWYNTETASWLSADPIGFAAGDTNLYRFAGNNVLVYVDPYGLQPPLVIGQPGQPSGQPIGPSLGIDSPIPDTPITLPPVQDIINPGGAIGRRIGEVPIIRGGPPTRDIIINPGEVVDDYWQAFLDRLEGKMDDVVDGAEQDWIDLFPGGDYSKSGGLRFGMFTHKYRTGASCCGTDGFGGCGEANYNSESSISCVVVMQAGFEASSGPFEAFGAISSRFAGGLKHSIDAQVGVDASVNGANASCDFSSSMTTVTEGKVNVLGGVHAGDLDYDRIAFYAMMAARAAANESGVNWNAQVMVGTVFEIGNTRAYVSCAGGVSGDQDGSSTSLQGGVRVTF